MDMRRLIITDLANRVVLKSIASSDIEFIREIKNNNRKSFFFQDIISEHQQRIWFEEYVKHENDLIFTVSEKLDDTHKSIGCLGFRLKDGVIDIYNVIRGRESLYGVSMHEAMELMVSYIRDNYNEEITCNVLKDNPAVRWYENCGFKIEKEHETYYDMIPLNVKSVEYIEKTE